MRYTPSWSIMPILGVLWSHDTGMSCTPAVFYPRVQVSHLMSPGYRGTVVKTTPGSHMKSLRFKTYTVSNQKQLQAVSEAKYFWTVPIPYDPPKFAVVFAQWNPPRRTIRSCYFWIFWWNLRFPKVWEERSAVRICSPSVDDSTAWLVPQYQVVSLDYKPVQWNWEEVKIQWWNCAKYERWCTMM
jgi:hypothetical protein